MKDKIIQIIFTTLILLPVAYVAFNIIKIIAMVLFPNQINMPINYFGDGWVIDQERDLWGIFIVWVVLSIYSVKKIFSNNENK